TCALPISSTGRRPHEPRRADRCLSARRRRFGALVLACGGEEQQQGKRPPARAAHGVSFPSRDAALSQAPGVRKTGRLRTVGGVHRATIIMRIRRQILGSLLAALTSLPLLAQGPLPPPHSFGRDTRRTGAFTGAGTPLGLTCAPTAAGIDCAGFLA